MRRVISVVVINEHGVLSRISGLFSGRGYNIDSLTVAPIPESPYSRVSIVTNGDEKVFEQIVKQLHKLIPAYKVIESAEFIEKEMLLIKIPLGENLANFEAILRSYNGIIANVTESYVVAMIADDAKRIDCFLKIVKKFNPIDLVRSGSVLMDIQ